MKTIDYKNKKGKHKDPGPLTMKMASQITDLVLKTKVLVFYQMPKDTSNNSDTDSDKQTK